MAPYGQGNAICAAQSMKIPPARSDIIPGRSRFSFEMVLSANAMAAPNGAARC